MRALTHVGPPTHLCPPLHEVVRAHEAWRVKERAAPVKDVVVVRVRQVAPRAQERHFVLQN